MNAPVPPDNAGTEFDKWLDWDGSANKSSQGNSTIPYDRSNKISSAGGYYPISPLSTSNGDQFSSSTKSNVYSAPSSTGPLTPSHSSGSPDLLSASHIRLSGDTLRDDGSIYTKHHLKRKLSSGDEILKPGEKAPKAQAAGSKRPHNVIEKRYRANLNEKIAELRDSVPSLRILQKARNRDDGDGGSDDEDLDGLAPSGKLNKASILTKAVEYIRHLEFRNKRLESENKSLKERLQTLDKVIAQGGNNSDRATAFTTSKIIEQTSTDATEQVETEQQHCDQPSEARQPLPEAWNRIRQSQQSGEHYGHVYQNTSERSRLGGKWTSRIMLGSLAGLMVMEGFAESDQGSTSKEKGLFGIPLEILDGWTFLSSPRIYLATFAEYCHAGGIVPLIKGFLALTILAFFIFTYLFNSKPHPEGAGNKEVQAEPQAARPASPIEVRRRAWSTSMQALHLPHHSFFPEWMAVTAEWLNYTLRYFFGRHVYAWITGRTAEDEVARIKNWDIAIDAQLAGGDHEVSRSRVVLTIFGSGTLPQTPLRLMQKALHCRVLLWNMGLPGTTSSRVANYVATLFANQQWRRARLLHEKLAAHDPDRLPGYLNYLLQIDCDEVFNDVVTQRASNLMYDRPTSEYADDPLMDVVVEDYAIRSPLDAIAAWRSTTALNEALAAALQNPDSTDLLREHIQSALEIAPPGSAAETRALAVHAVLSPGRRQAFYTKATESMSAILAPPNDDAGTDVSVPFFIDSSTPRSVRPEIASCLQCAKSMLFLDEDRNVTKAIDAVSRCASVLDTRSILAAATQYFVLHRIWRISKTGEDLSAAHVKASELVDHFLGEAADSNHQFNARSSPVDFLRSIWVTTATAKPIIPPTSRRHSTVSNDTGYGSLSEQEDETRLVGHAYPSKLGLWATSELVMTMGV